MLLVFSFALAAFSAPNSAMADRQTSVSGALAIVQGYDSNIDRTDTDTVEDWTTSLSPSLTVTSKGMRDSLDLSYTPSFVYYHRGEDSNFDHRLSLAANRSLSDKAQISVRDSFEKTDDSTYGRDETLDTSDRVNLTENRRRYRYWTNFFDIKNDWQYAQNSLLSLGYSYSVFDTTGPSSDYQRHTPRISISHEINHQWTIGAGYTFTKGDFDEADDSNQHSTNGRLTYRLSTHTSLYGQGEYSKTIYDGDFNGAKIDYQTSGGLIGFSRQLDQNTAFDIAGGYSSLERDRGADFDGFNSSLSFTRQLEKGTFTLSGASGFDDQQFNGENDGLSKFWTAKSTLRYQLNERLFTAIYALFRNDKYKEQVPERKEDAYEAGASLNCSFARYYTAGIRYVFHKRDSNINGADYDDHRLYLTLSAANELWRW